MAVVCAATLLAAFLGFGRPASGADAVAQRRAMIDAIRAYTVEGSPPIDEKTLAALGSVSREEFVPDDLRARAYEDSPLPIGYGQTISQPYIVALMTSLAAAEPGKTVLEVGTGSGYQAAVLAKLGAKVFTIEIVEPLAKQASERLARLGYTNVEVKAGDGYAGWREHAPFDAIVVTAAPDTVPPPLIEQLKPGGRLVIPVGSAGLQELSVIEKKGDGTTATRKVLPVRFVPFTGTH